MIVLAVDTSTLQAGVAIWRNERVLASRQRIVTTHSDALMLMVDEAFADAGVIPADLDAIAGGAGPGSFTGLRIALSTAKGLCFALDKPLVMISSLAALAARAPDGRVCATLDAFRGEVYAGIFTVADGVPIVDGSEAVLPPAALMPRLHDVAFVVGSGAAKYPALVAAHARLLDEHPGPRPADVARLAAIRVARGDLDDLSRASPTYIRPFEGELVKKARPQ